MSFKAPLIGFTSLALAACQTASSNAPGSREITPSMAASECDLPIARAPFDELQASWKQRLDQPYVYLEQRGDYRGVGRVIERLLEAADQAALDVQGPPFALYYDDPGRVAVDQLRLRACLPVAATDEIGSELQRDVLDSTTVVYAYVAGPYPEVPRAYPKLFDYLRELDWVEVGPIREVYLRDPSQVASWDELVTEVQIPAARRP